MKKKSNTKRNIIKTLIGFSLTLLIIYIAVFQIGTANIMSLLGLQDNAYTLESKWVNEMYGNGSIILETPKTLEKAQLIQLPEEVKAALVNYETYRYEEGNNLTILLNIAQYQPSITANLEGAAAGAMKQMEAQPEVRNFTYEQDEYPLANMLGIRQDGSFERIGDKNYAFTNVIFTKDAMMWQISISYPQDDINGALIVERVLQSIVIG
ncbi:MAG: hypothetical protein MUE81_08580 [Thermoflexibacter sp.]|jgi:hypothetical protein|nr:hypothetical protein [Thermoflexibacter sp.]